MNLKGKYFDSAVLFSLFTCYLLQTVSQLVRQLHSRDTRHAFCPANHWLAWRVNIQADKVQKCLLCYDHYLTMLRYPIYGSKIASFPITCMIIYQSFTSNLIINLSRKIFIEIFALAESSYFFVKHKPSLSNLTTSYFDIYDSI